MIPAEFDYQVAGSVDEALQALADGDEDTKLLAGGHSLIPLMKMRLAVPTKLVDISGISELRGIQSNGSLKVGALTRHVDLQSDPSTGVLAKVAHMIADQQVRNRGTVGGSIVHGDPAADTPTAVLAADATITVRGQNGERQIAAADMFVDYMQTSIEPNEVLISIDFGDIASYGWGYEKFTRRAEDWAMVGVVALIKKASDGSAEDVRVGLTQMGSTPLRATAVEEALKGQALDADTIAKAAEQAAEGTNPAGDLNSSPDYKRHLARVLTRRALEAAAA